MGGGERLQRSTATTSRATLVRRFARRGSVGVLLIEPPMNAVHHVITRRSDRQAARNRCRFGERQNQV
jgi:hypothetical protein